MKEQTLKLAAALAALSLWATLLAQPARVTFGIGTAPVPAGFAQSAATDHLLTIGFYLVAPCGSDLASSPMKVAGGPNQCFEPSELFNQTDVASAEFDQRVKDRPVIKLILREAAAQRFSDLAGRKIGNQIGEFVDGSLISVATIAAPARTVSIEGLTQQAALSVIQAFQRGLVASFAPAALPGSIALAMREAVTAPRLIYKSEPEYTAAARAARIEGTVLLKVTIRPDGIADDISVQRSLDPGLDAKAIECVRRWRFRPGQKDGKPVAATARVEVGFHL